MCILDRAQKCTSSQLSGLIIQAGTLPKLQGLGMLLTTTVSQNHPEQTRMYGYPASPQYTGTESGTSATPTSVPCDRPRGGRLCCEGQWKAHMLPGASVTTYIFVAISVLVIMLVAVPEREKVVRRGQSSLMERGHGFSLREQPHDGATTGGQQGRQNGGEAACSPASPPSSGPAVGLTGLTGQCDGGEVGGREGAGNVLLGHLCVLQDVHVDEERLLVLPHAAQQQCPLF